MEGLTEGGDLSDAAFLTHHPLSPGERHQVLKHSCFVKKGEGTSPPRPPRAWHREFLFAAGAGTGWRRFLTPSVENHYRVMRKMKQCKFYKLRGDAEK